MNSFPVAASGVHPSEAEEAIKWSGGGSASVITKRMRADIMLKEEEMNSRKLSTRSDELDGILGGGVRAGEVLEVFGGPGTGKSQLAMQLCASVQSRPTAGGLQRGAIYADSEGGFMAERLSEMLKAEPCANEQSLSRVWLYRLHSWQELRALVEVLPRAVEQAGAGLVVVDSIAFHLKQGLEIGERQRVLQATLTALTRLAKEHSLAVVAVNHAVAKPSGEQAMSSALGESFGHMCSRRVRLGFQGFAREARLLKAPDIAPSFCRFDVTSHGIRDRKKRPTPDGGGGDDDDDDP